MDTHHKIYSSAPLPFVGQKRNALKFFRPIINEHILNQGRGWTIIDVFGGSGLLAHNVKRLKPEATVIYNDFDGYSHRLNHIDDINRLRQLIYPKLQHIPRQKRVTDDVKADILDIINSFDGYIDARCLSTWLLFSGKQIHHVSELQNHEWYNTIRKSDYSSAIGYLGGLEITHDDFSVLIERYQRHDNVLLLLDPPYLCTMQQSYANELYFGMTNFLRLMMIVKPPYIFFSSTKSELLDYMQFVEQYDKVVWQRLGGFEHISFKACVNNVAQYEDNMIFKF